jgi:hypothetical protein
MVKGLQLPQDYDESKKDAIEYLSFTEAERSVVLKSQLIPYGKDGAWDPELLQDFLNKQSNYELCERQRLFLQKFLDVAQERDAGLNKQQASQNKAAEERPEGDAKEPAEDGTEEKEASDIAPGLDDRAFLEQFQVFSPQPDENTGPNNQLLNGKKEPLKAGDVIEYTRVVYAAGDERGKRTCIILAINPSNWEYPLILDDETELLPRTHPVKRLFFRYRGSYKKNEGGTHKQIRHYKLSKSEVSPDDEFVKRMRRKDVNEIWDEKEQKFREDMEREGFGCFLKQPSDKSRKRKSPEKPALVVDDATASSCGSSEVVAKLESLLEQVQRLTSRRAKPHMSAEALQLAILVQGRCGNGSVSNLASELDLSEYGLSHYLQGDEKKLVNQSQQEEISIKLREWLASTLARGEDKEGKKGKPTVATLNGHVA